MNTLKDVSFKTARKRMALGLKEESLRQTYRANIAMCIYDNRRKDGRLNVDNCNDVAEKLIKLIFES